MILVTGATGNVGRSVVEQLTNAGLSVRAASRDPERAAIPTAAEPARVDLADPGTFAAALNGVDKVFLFPAPGAEMDAFAAAAKQAGVSHVVLLSSMIVSLGVRNAVYDAHAPLEAALTNAGLTTTFLRPGQFMSNDLLWAKDVQTEGVVRFPYGLSVMAPVDAYDIAAVGVTALLNDGHEGQAYDLTGPESLTVLDRVRILGEVLGRELRFEEQTREEALQAISAYMPPPVVDLMLDFWAGTVGTQAPTLPTVENVTGRPAHTYKDWATRNAPAFTARPA